MHTHTHTHTHLLLCQVKAAAQPDANFTYSWHGFILVVLFPKQWAPESKLIEKVCWKLKLLQRSRDQDIDQIVHRVQYNSTSTSIINGSRHESLTRFGSTKTRSFPPCQTRKVVLDDDGNVLEPSTFTPWEVENTAKQKTQDEPFFLKQLERLQYANALHASVCWCKVVCFFKHKLQKNVCE